MKKDIRMIAFDLDGTMLDDNKNLPEENRQALLEAVARGILIVPATGRLPMALPDCIQALPIRYGIFINGAEVTNLQTGESISQTLIPYEQAVAVYRESEQWDIIYDCYQENKAYMGVAHKRRIPEFALNAHYFKMMTELRVPVPELKAYLADKAQGVQKLQFYFRKDQYPLRETLLHSWKIPGIEVSSSVPNNLELNHAEGTKGYALEHLARHLGIDMAQVMVFGDGDNDRTMLQKAGVAVAMKNAEPVLKELADYITGSNNDAGVAQAIREICL